ncbi:MAG: DNA polymerase III subunit gamma/tau [Xenococcus sp. (in: cyanobacteria)]
MAYEPLHHKYRPQTFGDLVGQEAIANTLINAIEQEKIATAYLFTGPRGTGKTSSARILAKSLNCLASPKPTATPCGKCAVCQAIANGTALDVIEIDAASNTGVDNIREIIERSRFAPAQSRYKVYAIDECHMLSTAAFNALLKTLEEPPPQVVFILATTDPQRVLSTIISRCQRFDYRRIPLGEMISHLEYIAVREKIAIAKPAITLVAQIANGGLRDAESLLDQLSLFPETITVEKVWDLVGAIPEKDLLGLLRAIRSKNLAKILEKCRNLLDRGKEPLVVLQNLASFYLNLLIAKTSPQRNDLVAVTETCWQELQTEAVNWQIPSILQGQQQLKDAEVQLKNTTQPRLWLEVTLLGLVSHSYVNQETSTEPLLLRNSFTIETDKKIGRPGNNEDKKTTDITENIVSQQQNSSSTVRESPEPAPIDHSSAISQPQQSLSAQLPVKKIVEPISNQPNTDSATVSQPQPVQNKPTEPIAETETKATSPEAIPDQDRELIWQKAIALVQPPTTRTLLSQKCHLINIKDSMVIMGVVSPPLIKLIRAKIANIETAFSQACQRTMKVTLEVANHKSQSANNTSHSNANKLQSNSSSSGQTVEKKTIETPDKIPASDHQSLAPSPPTVPTPPPQTKPLVSQEKTRSPINEQTSHLSEIISESPAISEPQNPVADEAITSQNQDVIADTPAEGDFQKAVELLAKSFDGEIITLGNLVENLPSAEKVEEKEISNSLNTQTNQEQFLEQSTKTIRNRPDLTMYEDEDEVPF